MFIDQNTIRSVALNLLNMIDSLMVRQVDRTYYNAIKLNRLLNKHKT